MFNRKLTPLEIAWIKAKTGESITKVLYKVGFVAMIALTLWSIVLITLQVVLPANGYGVYNIVGQSMQPTHYEGGLIISNNNEHISDLHTGDIICFESPNGDNICHRVHMMSDDKTYVETKGDHNNSPEDYVTNDDNLIGHVIAYIPMAGFIVEKPIVIIMLLALTVTFLTLSLHLLYIEFGNDRYNLQPTFEKFCVNRELKRRVEQAMNSAA